MTDNLTRAADYIEQYGLNRDGCYFKGVPMLISVYTAKERIGLPSCALGAIYATAETDAEAMASCARLAAAVPAIKDIGDAHTGRFQIPHWSDRSDAATVTDTLRRAATG
jgi:hypothetical protein